MLDQPPVTVHEFAGAASRDADARKESDERSTVWAFVWTLFLFKLATAIAILWAAGWTGEAGIILGATHWFWLFLPTFAVAGPVAFHYRLRRIRNRREELRRAEWMIE